MLANMGNIECKQDSTQRRMPVEAHLSDHTEVNFRLYIQLHIQAYKGCGK